MGDEVFDWKRTFAAWERAVGTPLENMVQSDQFAEVLAAFVKNQSELRQEMSAVLERWLHLWNLPTAGDMRGLQDQVRKLELEVRALRRELRRREATATPAEDG